MRCDSLDLGRGPEGRRREAGRPPSGAGASMQYVRLGPTGTRVSRVCLGSGPFGVGPVEADAIELAAEHP
jgi:hypothetical protein